MNDIAILKLSQPVTLNKNVQITCLPNPKFETTYPPSNITSYAVGYENSCFLNLKKFLNLSYFLNCSLLDGVYWFLFQFKLIHAKIEPIITRDYSNNIYKGEDDMSPMNINNVALEIYDSYFCENVTSEIPKNWY